MLKPMVITLRIRQDWPALISHMLGERNSSSLQPEIRHAQLHIAQAQQALLLLAGRFGN
jgi:hypothetical protein